MQRFVIRRYPEAYRLQVLGAPGGGPHWLDSNQLSKDRANLYYSSISDGYYELRKSDCGISNFCCEIWQNRAMIANYHKDDKASSNLEAQWLTQTNSFGRSP
jgi:hypothetical protein